jgi:RHS repeat-associated protein
MARATILATAVAVLVPGTAVAELSLPVKDPSKVANPSSTVAVVGTGAVGGTRGSASVSAAGTASYSIPLVAVPGRGGLQPRLALSYSSAAGNGQLGVGFSLSGLSQIHRCSKTVADDQVAQGVQLTESDRFCLDGQRLVASSGVYGADGTEYRTLPDTHVRVRSFRAVGTPASEVGPTSFTVWRPDGRVEFYGELGAKAQVRTASGSLVNTAWMVRRAEDRSGNAIQYTYGRRIIANSSEVERWIDFIRYGRSDVMDRMIKFGYEDRPDRRVGYSLGQPRESTKRLKSVEMALGFAGEQGARSYVLSYENIGATKASKLKRVQECSVGDGTTATSQCKRATILSWTLGSEGFSAGKVQGGLSLVPPLSSQVVAADFTGDGRTDVAWPESSSWKVVPAQAASGDDVYTTSQAGPANASGVGVKAWPLDYDNNGWMDLLPRDGKTSADTWKPQLSRPTGWAKVSTPFTGGFNRGDADAAGAFPGDFDGDGYQDVLQYERVSATSWAWRWRRNTGAVSSAIDFTTPTDDKAFGPALPVALNGDPAGVTIADVFGDGRDKLLFKQLEQLYARDLATGSLVNLNLSGNVLQLDKQWLDLNGDGLVDLVTNGSSDGVQGETLYYWLNTGRGFTGAVSTGVKGSIADALAVDYDGDGRRELLVPKPAGGAQIQPLYVGLDVIRANVSPGGVLSFTRGATTVTFNAMSVDDFTRRGPRTVDADGDGLTDVLLVERPPVGSSGSPALKLFLHKTDGGAGGDRHDLLWQVHEGDKNPTGPIGDLPATVEFQYKPLTDSAVHTGGACPRVTGFACARGGSYVVWKVLTDSGVDATTQMWSLYHYRDGRIDKFRRDSLGFAERRVTTFPGTDLQRSTVERSFYSNTVRYADPRLLERWVIHNLAGGKQRMERTDNVWASKITGSAPQLFFNYVAESRRRSYEFDTIANLATSLTPAQFNAQGKTPFTTVIRTVSDMDVFGTARTTVTLAESVKKVHANRTTVLFEPDVDTVNWLVRRPRKVITSDEAMNATTGVYGPKQTRTRLYTYEGATDRVDTVKSYASDTAPGRQLLTAFDYEHGNVIRRSSTDVADGKVRETTYAYDDYGYLHAVQNGRGHTSYTGYDPVLGVVKVAVDPNGLRTDYTYDTLGRLVKTRLPSGAETTRGHSLVQRGIENLIQVEAKDGTGAVTQTVFDRSGRPVTERFKGFDNNLRERTLTYTPEGQLATQSVFHRLGTPDAQVAKTSYSYDVMGRITQQRDPDSAAPRTWSYNERTVTFTDTRGNVKTTTVDHNGLVVRHVDDDGTSVKPAREHLYGPFGTLVSTKNTATSLTETRYVYDDLGALVSSKDAERGTTTYGHNAFGEVTSVDDANGRHTVIGYDVLGRETQRTTTKNGATTSTVTRTWDTAGTRTWRGALLQVAANHANPVAGGKVTTDYTYDTLGRLDQVSQTQPASSAPTAPLETLTADYDVDTHGRVTAVRYPKLKGQTQGAQVTYTYAPAATSNGRLTSVQTGTETLWTAKDTDDQDRLVKEQAGDGTVTSQSLDWDGRVLNRAVATGTGDISPNATLFAENYSYDDEGNLETRSQGGITERFTYDKMNRLATAKTFSATTGQVYQTDSWLYDKLGNITTSELRGTHTYHPNRPHLATQVTGGLFGTRTYGYDAVGNQTIRPGATVTYNDLNLPAVITPTTGTGTGFLYDGNSERVRKTSATTTITYLPGLYERHQTGSGNQHRLLVKAGGSAVATLVYQEAAGATNVTKQSTLFTHTDHLGSPRLVTKNKNTTGGGAAQAVPVERRSYDAFGKPRNPDLTKGDDQYTTGIEPRSLHQGYTGHTEDDELGLVNMNARIYDPTLGRFTTPDMVVTGANPTQAFNRYTYVSNNPLRYTDPTGHAECDASSNCQDEICPTGTENCSGTEEGDCPPGALCADPVTIIGDPPEDEGDPNNGPIYQGGAPGSDDDGGPDRTPSDSCRPPLRCDDLPETEGDPKDGSECRPLCDEGHGGFGYKEPTSTPTQTNNVTAADPNQTKAAATDVPSGGTVPSKLPPETWVTPQKDSRGTGPAMGADGVIYPTEAAAREKAQLDQNKANWQTLRTNPVASILQDLGVALGWSDERQSAFRKAAGQIWAIASGIGSGRKEVLNNREMGQEDPYAPSWDGKRGPR